EKIDAFGADSLTVNGYLGSDGINPLLKICDEKDKGIFVLVKTSNPSSGELQDKKIDGKTVYENMGEMCERWGEEVKGKYGYSGVGAVVGATYPEMLKELRVKLPHTFFLVPGYGAQGGGADDVKFAFDKNGIGAVINSSRGIMCAWTKKDGATEKDFADAAREEAIRMRDDIRNVVGEMKL
ncbi:MAG: orotidine-5'-phosphate decarboxylase, partial [Ruminococcus sp.]|nr:orotidine-5'-phosphate decarboxylase [Ruminococcus sp.]